jgi:hypothetical protein
MRELKFKYYFKVHTSEGIELNKVIFTLNQIQERNFTGREEDCIAKEQFTGLRNKSGLDIYTGDILDQGWIVSFKDGAFGVFDSNHFMHLTSYISNQRETIGNIHDNKDLV